MAMFTEIKRVLIVRPLATEEQHNERLNKVTALAVFSSDALSSVAYATEAILGVLILAGSAFVNMSLPIAGGIAFLLLVVAFSYRQTIHAYPNGGGAYIVAKENLGETSSMIAAAALLTDYVLTVAVSISAGVAALVSLAGTWGFPDVRQYNVDIAVIFLMIVTLANLRGVKESGAIFAVPTYLFVVSILSLLVVGIAQVVLFGATPITHPAPLPMEATEDATGWIVWWVILRAFAAGCTALTGVEAISNGVPAFRPPESRNAATTLTLMVMILITMFLGITWLAHQYGALPNEVTHETVVSQIARGVFGPGPIYLVIQVSTAMILVLAANTAFADFPRLASLLARDRFLPRQLSSRGDRLVFSNGILVLGACSAVLIVGFRANEIAMLPLYALGVFISFTLSQAGMVMHWFRQRGRGWHYGITINGLGALLTLLVLIVLIVTKFTHGAWAVLVLIPILVVLLRSVYSHYTLVADQLSLAGYKRAPAPPRRHRAIVLAGDLHRGVLPALDCARTLAHDCVTAVYVETEPDQTERVKRRWSAWEPDIPLVVLPSPYRSLIGPVLRYVDEQSYLFPEDLIFIVVPEFVPRHWWEHFLHNQSALVLRTAMMFRSGKIVVNVPYRLAR